MAEARLHRGRFHHHHHHHHHDKPGPAVPVVDQAECTAGQTCRSCVAVTLADAIALGCCPCAVLSLLGLALVKAPLAVARRCLRQMRRRWGDLRRKKRVRDDMAVGPTAAGATKAKAKAKCCRRYGEALDVDAALWWGLQEEEGDARGEVDPTWARARASRSSSSASASGRLDAEKVWMEMYRVGNWGFGRLSISVTPPPAVTLSVRPDGDGGGDGGGRKDVDLRCES